MTPKEHEEIEVVIHGQSILVDKGVSDLVVLLNNLPGIETYTSCQGGEAELKGKKMGPKGFVGFRGAGVPELVSKLAFEIARQEEFVETELEIDAGRGLLRWNQRDYQRVLSMVKLAVGRPALRVTKLMRELGGPLYFQ
jgi:hypothetical protein